MIIREEITSLLDSFGALSFQYDSTNAFCTYAKNGMLCLSLDWIKLNCQGSLLLEKTLDLHEMQVLF